MSMVHFTDLVDAYNATEQQGITATVDEQYRDDEQAIRKCVQLMLNAAKRAAIFDVTVDYDGETLTLRGRQHPLLHEQIQHLDNTAGRLAEMGPRNQEEKQALDAMRGSVA